MTSETRGATKAALPKSGPRTRSHKRGETTRVSLIEIAESMFGTYGLEGVSLRQIGLKAGSANENVVSYHFGSKEGLIEAIFQHRLPGIEARRAELLAIATQTGRANSLSALADAIWRPWYEQTNSRGRHSYAAFLQSIGRSDWHLVRREMDNNFPVTREISNRIDGLLPKMSRQNILERWILASVVIMAALQRIDLTCADDVKRAAMMFADAERASVAVLTAPTK